MITHWALIRVYSYYIYLLATNFSHYTYFVHLPNNTMEIND